MYLAWEAMSKLVPDIYIGNCILARHLDKYTKADTLDTMGYAFTFHVAKFLAGVTVGAYVHYPTISTDMLARVKSRKQWHTNSDAISSSLLLSNLKLMFDYSSFSQSTGVDDLMAQILPTIYVLLCVFTASSVFHHGQFIMD